MKTDRNKTVTANFSPVCNSGPTAQGAVSAAASACEPPPCLTCGGNPNSRQQVTSLSGQIITSGDPNDKVGSQGFGAFHFLTGSEPLRYSIYFENQPTASAAAQDVVVTDPLDKTRVDLNTLALGPISFVDKLVNLSTTPLFALGTFSQDIDLRPTQNLIARVSASLNTTSGVLTWHFQSIDPATGKPTTDPVAGFLPIGGEGSVNFTVMPKAPVTGTQITNQATVVFDLNPPINTPVWLNTIDNTAPVSKVSAFAGNQTSPIFTVQWSGTDVGSGVQDYTVYVSDNSGAFSAWQTNSTVTLGTFTGQVGHSYGFYSIARDHTGNVETAKTAPEATITIQNLSSATATTAANASLIFSPTSQAVALSAALSSSSVPVNGGTVAFTLLGATVSGAVSNGAASANFTVPGGTQAGAYPLMAVYNPGSGFTGSSDTKQLTIGKATPTVVWSNPADIVLGTALGASQLNATASVPGAFTYTPSAGTVLPIGNGQTLSVVFVPSDLTDYNTRTATVLINVKPIAGDLNADGKVDCADVAIVRVAYGTAAGNPMFDARADVNGDGVVGIGDLVFVVGRLTAGALCPDLPLFITNYQLVSRQAAAGLQSALTYRADLVNVVPALGSMTATLTGLNPFFVRVAPGQDTLTFRPVPSNSQVTSGGTFTILTDASVPFNASKLQWTFQSTAADPVANPGPNQTVKVGSTVTLDGSGSMNPSGVGTLAYSWMFTSRPPGTRTVLTSQTVIMPTFVADVPGSYVVQLTVGNGSASATASVTVIAN